MLLSSHLLHEIEIIADDLVVIGNGKIVASGTKEELCTPAGRSPGRSSTEALPTHSAPRHPQHARRATAGPHRRRPGSDRRPRPTNGIALTELRPAEGAGLEDMFLSLTADTQRDVTLRRSTRMTATTPSGGRLDVSRAPPDPVYQLVRPTFRADTWSGKWLLSHRGHHHADHRDLLPDGEGDRPHLPELHGLTATPQGFLLPVLGILLVTSEWTQRPR